MNHRRIGSACLVTGVLILGACSSDSGGGGPATGTGGAMGAATGGATGLPGTGGATGMVGTGGSTGTGGATSAVPTGGATSAVPTGGATSTVPTGGATSVLPTGGTTSVLPTGGTTSVLPTGGTTSVLPTGGTTSVLPTGGTTGTPTGGATGTPTGGATSTPTGGATGTTGGTTGTGGTTEPPEPLGGYHVHGDWSGFAFTFATDDASIDPDAETGFTAMINEDGPYCVSGSVAGTEDYKSIAAVGFNTNQQKVEEAEANGVVSTGSGLYLDIDVNGGSDALRVQIEDGTADNPDTPDVDEGEGHRWCVNLSEFGSDVPAIPWEAFNLTCWDPDDDDAGTAFDPSTPIVKVIVYIPDNGESEQQFDFCVNDIGPDNVQSRGEGEIVASCGNSVSWGTTGLSGTSSARTTDGSYGIQANAWDGGSIGISALGGCGFSVDSTQCNKTEPTDGPCSFPSVYRGIRWGGENTTSSGGFPKQVSAISSIPTCMGWSSGSGDGYNISFDVWFASSSGATQPEKYLMLWFRTPEGWQPAGDFPEADGVVIGSQIWSRWYGPNTSNQPVVSYAAPGTRADGQAYSFDLKDFIDDAVEQGHINSSDYLISVMAGTEIWSGGQGVRIDGFRTEVQ